MGKTAHDGGSWVGDVTTVQQAQDDIRVGYHSGAPGVLASALVWGAAAAATPFLTQWQAVAVLFFGGMLIFPLGLLIAKMLGGRGSHTPGNPLASLAMANTFWMLMCMPLAAVAEMQTPGWFFAGMLLIIGGRYLTFAVMYGMKLYWVLGFALAAVGFGTGYLMLAPVVIAGAGAAIELAFAFVLFAQHAKWTRGRAAPIAA